MLARNGEVQYLIHRVEDVTESVIRQDRIQTLQMQQKEDHAIIEHQRNLLQALLDQAPVGIGFLKARIKS